MAASDSPAVMDLSAISSAVKLGPEPNKRLACQACQKRKIKCDRNLPCQQCRRKNISCIPIADQRRPRGRNGGRSRLDGNLINRIAKLESMLSQVQPQTSREPAMQHSGAANESPPDVSNDWNIPHVPSQAQYLGTAFWSTIKAELAQLQDEIGEGSPSTEPLDDLDEDVKSPWDGTPASDEAWLDPLTSLHASTVLFMPPPPLLAQALCELYFGNVDRVFKVLHAPSVRAHIVNGAPYLDYADDDRGVQALKFVIFYAALSTATEEQCWTCTGQAKASATRMYRTMAEGALSKADYMTTDNFATVQALVIYIAMRRSQDTTRRTWVIFGALARISLALRLHMHDNSADAFTNQQRSRLWHAICLLDLILAVDLGSDASILPGLWSTPLPLNINDSDMVPDSVQPIVPREGWTDMTFTLMFRSIALYAHKAHNTNAGSERQVIAKEMCGTVEATFLSFCDPTIPFHSFTIAFGRSTASAVLVHTICPTKASNKVVSGAVSTEHVLAAAVEALSYSNQFHENVAISTWRWIAWRTWHSLAVAFAGLASINEGTLCERAWPVVETAYQQYLSDVGDGQQAQLGRPLRKLAKRARESRAKKLSLTALPTTSAAVPDFTHAQSVFMPAENAHWPANWAFPTEFPAMSAEELDTWNTLLQEFPDPMDFNIASV